MMETEWIDPQNTANSDELSLRAAQVGNSVDFDTLTLRVDQVRSLGRVI